MRVFAVIEEHFDENEQCTITTLKYNDSGFVFVGRVGSKPNPWGLAGGLTFPVEGKIYFNKVEIYSGLIVGEIEEYFNEYMKSGKIKKKHKT